ncbi:MAG: FKBP-type peptidyl-prolyl cis-trans isomerase [Sphingomonadales bacterium]|nr:FKBP-type peptidyl-prolyl cis-trans isomerase [Sphingomonadales bacterium]MBM3923289.1 FKBP-type peptidyl-prolyl cis-trans isomerase [Sphingomonadales bacterium]
MKKEDLKTELDTVSYSLGVNIGSNIKQQGVKKLNLNALMKGMEQALSGDSTWLNDQEAMSAIQGYFTKISEAKGAESKKAGEAFLAENGKKKDITTTASGLQYEVIKMGDGDKPLATDEVTVHYHGTTTDGQVFDSSKDRGEPATFPLNGVIAGWTEALQLMPKGSIFKLYLPSNLAYGERGAGEKIPPHAVLIFEVELLDIKKK